MSKFEVDGESEFLKKLEELNFSWIHEASEASLLQAMPSEGPPNTQASFLQRGDKNEGESTD